MPVGVLFISLQLTWLDVLTFLAMASGLMVVNLAAVVLPVVALFALQRRRWKRALTFAALAVLPVAWCFGPLLGDAWRTRQLFAEVRQAQITRHEPDLTGKVVAYLGTGDPKSADDSGCVELVRHSGAAKVYLLDSEPGWGGEIDLAARAFAQAVVLPLNPASPDGLAYCAAGSADVISEEIDYFVARHLLLGPEHAALGLLPSIPDDRVDLRLDEYFAPVTDARHVRLAPDAADLVRISVQAEIEGFPRPFSSFWRAWPGRAEEIDWFHGPAKAALCRHASAECAPD